jgi:sulfate transport system ATP-binding protein
MNIRVLDLHKSFGSFVALSDVSLEFPAGRLTALLGPSGCGKTTLLRIVAGLEHADSGEVWFDGEDASGLDARERRVGFVFQHYALFRHMSVFDNVAFGLRVRPRRERHAELEIERRVRRLLELVQLGGLEARRPQQLSGGQRQRVALARALAIEPRVLLLDEPFGALDAQVRKELRRWLRQLHEELHITSIFVTHDQEEALEVADRVVLMNQGRVEQAGTPAEVYREPATRFVHAFLGSANRFDAEAEDGVIRVDGQPLVSERVAAASGRVHAYARPDELQIDTDTSRPGLQAHVKRVHGFGATSRVELAASDGRWLEVELPRARSDELALVPGQAVRVTASRVAVYAADAA